MTDDLRAQLQSTLGSAYHLERELGGGGMSRVFVARDESLGRDVVIKVLSPELAASLSAERFTREIRLAAALQEPHIVPLLAAGATTEGVPWYTMPFVRGDSLRARIQLGPIPLNESLGILRNIAQALAYAHERDIVHRDIKPENVLLSSGTAIVTDFGIAKALSASSTRARGSTLTSVGTSIGTPAYMAPEQAVGDASTDFRADIYAWGVVAYELLTSSHPFASRNTPQALIAAHLTELPAPIATPGVPDIIRSLVLQCLAKDPAERPDSARDILRVLDSASTPPAVHVPSLPPNITGAHGVSRRSPVIVAALAVLALGAGVIMFARSRSGAAAGASTDRSIAVLPFENATRDTTQEYVADGLTEELIGRLATIGMRVTGRNSVFTYKGQHPTPRAIGSSLRVGSVMTGSVRRAGEQLHVSAELASTSNDFVMWSFSVDRPATQILALQKELVDSIANRFRLASGTERRRATAGTTNLAARDAYMRGQFLSYKLTQKDLAVAIAEYDEAIRLDPHYALPHVGKAVALGWLADGFVAPLSVIGPVREEIAKAKATDSTVAEVWTMAAVAEMSWGWDWAATRRYIDRAVALNGGDANTWFAEMGYQLAQGNMDAAMKASDEAYRLDPLSPGIVGNRFFLPLLAGHVDEASRRAREVPASIMAVLNYGDAIPVLLLELTGQRQAAESAYVNAEKLMGHRSPSLGVFYVKTGRLDAARRMLADIERTWPAKYIPPELVARLPAALGDTATMYKWLERGLAARSAWVGYLNIIQLEFSPHRAEPHFQSILARAGLKDAGTSVRR